MTLLPEAGIGEESMFTPRGLWRRAKSGIGARMGYALADQVVYSFGNMVVAALISRHCAQREFGIYILTQRALDFIFQLCNIFLWAPFTFNLPSQPAERKQLFAGSIFLQQLASCGFAALLLYGGSRWAATPSRGLYYGVFAPLVATSAGILFREYTRRMYFAEIRLKEAFWTDAATVALQIAGVEWLYYKHQLNVPNTLWMLAFGSIVVSIYWLLREYKHFEFALSEAIADARLNLKLGRWFLGSNMVFMFSSQCNPWILSGVLGGVSVGAYAVCESVVNIPRVALTSMQNIMAPMMARAYADGGKLELRKMVSRLDAMLLGGAAIFAVIIFAAGPWAARIIFKNVPDNARSVLILLSLNLVAYAGSLAQSYGLTAVDRAGDAFYSALFGLCAQVGVSVWLVRHFHVPGAAAAMLVGSVVVLGVRRFYYLREMNRVPQTEAGVPSA